MIKMTTTVTENGETKTISAWLDERTVKALEQANDEELIKQYIIDEHNEYLVELKETRRHQSLDRSLDNGFEVADEHCFEDDIFASIENERLKQALSILMPEQLALVKRVYFDGVPQAEIAVEQGVDPTAIRNRLNKIYKKMKNFLK